MTADYETALALAEDRAEAAERELAAIRWRRAALEVLGAWSFLLALDPVTSTTDEVCDALAEHARAQEEVMRKFGIAVVPDLDEALARIQAARELHRT